MSITATTLAPLTPGTYVTVLNWWGVEAEASIVAIDGREAEVFDHLSQMSMIVELPKGQFDPAPGREAHASCPDCGYHFTNRVARKCKTKTACAKRQMMAA